MRTQYCGKVTNELVNTEVVICGWLHSHRNHGGIFFFNIRDITGMVQVVVLPEHKSLFKLAQSLRYEFVIQVHGKVALRPENMINKTMPTGSIEIIASDLKILNASKELPFLPDNNQSVFEDLRYRYRYIDLRREDLQKNIILKHKLMQCMREFLNAQDFIDIETPMLTKATPEGARDYLVPSRVHFGKFYALPQSPQLFKQLLMMSGFDKYYQIVRCFRDEDLRADRQPEFTQLDIEMAFIEPLQIQNLIEQLLVTIFEKLLGVKLEVPFPRLSYHESMRRFGSDKPDLRNPLELVDIGDLFLKTDFEIFKKIANEKDTRIAALRLPQQNLSRKDIDKYNEYCQIFGAQGLAYLKVNHSNKGVEGIQSPIIKFLTLETINQLLTKTQAKDGDIIFICAGKRKIVTEAMGALRQKLAVDYKLLTKSWQLLWIVDWPLFESDESGNIQAMHHPFTAPESIADDLMEQDPLQIKAKAYDIVINGYEIGGGSIRIHKTQMQQKIFNLLGIETTTAKEKFGFLLEALDFGCPPHGGIALGVDRLAMLLTQSNSIREVIAFPKTQSAACLMTDAPANVNTNQLKELGIEIAQKTSKI